MRIRPHGRFASQGAIRPHGRFASGGAIAAAAGLCALFLGGCAKSACESAAPAFELEISLPRDFDPKTISIVAKVDGKQSDGWIDQPLSEEVRKDAKVFVRGDVGPLGADGFDLEVTVRVTDGNRVASGSESYTGQPNACNRFPLTLSSSAPPDGGRPDRAPDSRRVDGAYVGCTYVQTIGSGAPGYANGNAAQASFHSPTGLALHGATGSLLVTDYANHVIRRISSPATSKTVVSLVAGQPNVAGFVDGSASPDGDKPGLATFSGPVGIGVAGDSRIYVSEEGNSKIRVIDGTAVGSVTGASNMLSLAGCNEFVLLCQLAKLTFPRGVLVWDPTTLLVADTGCSHIRVLTPTATSCLTTLPVGRNVTAHWLARDTAALYVTETGPARVIRTDRNGGGLKTLCDTGLQNPAGIVVAKDGTVIVADRDAHRVMYLSDGQPVSLVGEAPSSCSDVKLAGPTGLALDDSGNLYIADTNNNVIRVVRLSL